MNDLGEQASIRCPSLALSLDEMLSNQSVGDFWLAGRMTLPTHLLYDPQSLKIYIPEGFPAIFKLLHGSTTAAVILGSPCEHLIIKSVSGTSRVSMAHLERTLSCG